MLADDRVVPFEDVLVVQVPPVPFLVRVVVDRGGAPCRTGPRREARAPPVGERDEVAVELVVLGRDAGAAGVAERRVDGMGEKAGVRILEGGIGKDVVGGNSGRSRTSGRTRLMPSRLARPSPVRLRSSPGAYSAGKNGSPGNGVVSSPELVSWANGRPSVAVPIAAVPTSAAVSKPDRFSARRSAGGAEGAGVSEGSHQSVLTEMRTASGSAVGEGTADGNIGSAGRREVRGREGNGAPVADRLRGGERAGGGGDVAKVGEQPAGLGLDDRVRSSSVSADLFHGRRAQFVTAGDFDRLATDMAVEVGQKRPAAPSSAEISWARSRIEPWASASKASRNSSRGLRRADAGRRRERSRRELDRKGARPLRRTGESLRPGRRGHRRRADREREEQPGERSSQRAARPADSKTATGPLERRREDWHGVHIDSLETHMDIWPDPGEIQPACASCPIVCPRRFEIRPRGGRATKSREAIHRTHDGGNSNDAAGRFGKLDSP